MKTFRMPFRMPFRLPFTKEWPVPALAFAAACAGLVLGLVSLATTAADAFAAPALGLLAAALGLLSLSRRATRGRGDRTLNVLAALAVGSALLLPALPQYVYPTNEVRFYAIIHRSIFSSLLLIGISLPAACSTLYYLLGETPGAEDLARYPLLLLPVLLVMSVYGLILWNPVEKGLPLLIQRPSALWTPYAGHMPPGLATHLLGTLVLTALTAAIALPIGVGTGIYLAEYATGPLGQLIATTTTALRSISVLILGLGAMYAVGLSKGTFLSDLISGYGIFSGTKRVSDGTYVTAAIFLSLLVVPIIARAAEEGCRALPRDLREASWALAASEGYTLWRVILPWAWPNIITALLLSCAEAAGSVAVIMFVAKTLDEPFSLLNRPTGLAFVIFEWMNASATQKKMLPPATVSALLLVFFTMGLNVGAHILRNHFAARYRGNQ